MAKAYETVFEESKRADYDDYLANPNAFYRNTAVYYGRQWVGQRETVWTVLLGVFVCCVVLDHLYRVHRYASLKEQFRASPLVQKKVLELRSFVDLGNLNVENVENVGKVEKSATLSKKQKKSQKKEKKCKKEKQTKFHISDEELHQVVTVLGDVFEEPNWGNLLVFRVWGITLSLCTLVYWCTRWFTLFWVLGEEYGEEEKEWLTRRRLGERRWEGMGGEERREVVGRELWREGSYEEWEREERRAVYAERRRRRVR